jgi:hypothetical protein
MSLSERLTGKPNQQEQLRQKFKQLRKRVHESMKAEEERRLRENPKPSEEELYMGAFVEWLEPQVRAAVVEMNRKGYATQSSGFHGTEPDLQTVDGYFSVDTETRRGLEPMSVEVLLGVDIGVPKNKLITMLRFRAKQPSIREIKGKWDAVASALPAKSLPQGIRPICPRAEQFRKQYAPEHPSLEEAEEAYLEHLQKPAG